MSTADVLVDADLLVYKAGHAAQQVLWAVWPTEEEWRHEEPFKHGYWKRKGDAKNWVATHNKEGYIGYKVLPHKVSIAEDAIAFMKQKIVNLVISNTAHNDAELNYYFSCKLDNNFRNKFPSVIPYKGNRADLPKPYWKDVIIKDFFNDGPKIGLERDNDLEADDLIGIAATEGKTFIRPIIASVDKDLNTIPGVHVNWDKESVYWVDEELARMNFYKQVLTGDAADNIVGIKGIGDRRASKILDSLANPTEEHLHQECTFKYMDYVKKKHMSSQLTSEIIPEQTLELTAQKWLNQNANLLWIQRYGREQWGRDENTLHY